MIYKNKTLNTDRKEVKDVSIDPANDDEKSLSALPYSYSAQAFLNTFAQ